MDHPPTPPASPGSSDDRFDLAADFSAPSRAPAPAGLIPSRPEDAAVPPRHLAIRPHPGAAWTIIFGMIAVLNLLPLLLAPPGEAGTEQEQIADEVAVRMMEFQSKVFLGFKYGLGVPEAQLAGQLEALNDGAIPQRQRYVVLAYEFGGIERAREALEEIDGLIAKEAAEDADEPAAEGRPEKDSDDATLAVQAALRRLYGEPAVDPPPPDSDSAADPAESADEVAHVERLTEDDREALIDELGWLGEIAVNPPAGMAATEREAMFAPIVTVLILGMVFGTLFALGVLGGLVGLIVLLVLALSGRLRSRVTEAAGRYRGVYIEAVALWLLIHFGAQLIIAPLLAWVLPAGWEMVAVVIVFFGTLIVLAWPVLRGVPWAVVRRDIGLTAGENPALEPVLGAAGYFMMVPILIVGVLLMLLLMALAELISGETGTPVHPIAGEAEGGLLQFAQLVLLACIAAPIVEETIFRGLMYTHLRDLGRRRIPQALSIVLSAVVSGSVFAIIHPQGILAVPALASIGFALALMREWRGTLIPSMIMHAASNAVGMTFLYVIMNL